MNRTQILQEIQRLRDEIEEIKNNPENPEEHSIFINTIMEQIAELEQALSELA